MPDDAAPDPNPTHAVRRMSLAARWRSMAPTARRLLAARFWRSLAQGALVVDLALYLNALGWSGAAIGGARLRRNRRISKL